jgi:regulator of protease activity HflC (stomatin/prohibitin superfamily)
MIRELTAAGLYEKEARAMVKTWDSAWFGEDGTRLLYLVPRARTDELLPLTIEPKPAEVVRVLVGRHDFLTPEQEASAEQQIQRLRAAQAEIESAESELSKIGRFAYNARRLAENRLETRSAPK